MSVKSSSRTISVAALVFTTTMWGLSFISTKVLLRRLAPIQVAFLRHAIASVAIWIAAAVARPDIRVSLRDLPTMLIAAVVGIPIYYYFENTGLLYLSAATASIITASTPAMTAAIESIFYRRRLPLAGWAGILVSAGGVALVVQSGAAQAAAASAAGRSDFLLGASMLLTSSFAWSLYTIFNRPNVASYGSLTTNAYQITFATAVLYVATLRNGVPWRSKGSAQPGLSGHLLFGYGIPAVPVCTAVFGAYGGVGIHQPSACVRRGRKRAHPWRADHTGPARWGSNSRTGNIRS